MKNYKTPIEDIFFRSSKIGLLPSGLIRAGLPEGQRAEMDKLEATKKELMSGLKEELIKVDVELA